MLDAIAHNQWNQLQRLLRGKPVRLTPVLSATLDQDDVALARTWLGRRSDWYAQAPVADFVDHFCRWLGVPRGWAFMGGRASLYAIVRALDLQPGDEVIVPAFTCQCVANAYEYHGVRVRFADIETHTYGIAADTLQAALTPATKAIMIQHTFGLVSRDFCRLLDAARARGLWVIEDCAHATGATWQGRKIGSFGDIAFFSSERSKIINTIHGGIVVTGRCDLARRMDEVYAQSSLPDEATIERQLNTVLHNWYVYKHRWRPLTADWAQWRYHARIVPQMQPEEYQGQFVAQYAQRMVAPVAALGLNQMRKLEHYRNKRREGAAHWDDWCQQQGLDRPLVLPDSEPAFLRYPVMVAPERKADLGWAADALGVMAGSWFTTITHPVPRNLETCPVGVEATRRVINLPTIFV